MSGSEAELNSLLSKVKVIYAVTGGKQQNKHELKKMSKINQKKNVLRDRIINIENIKESLENEPDKMSLKAIRLKNNLRQELSEISKSTRELDEIYALKSKKMSDDEKKEIADLIESSHNIIPKSEYKEDDKCFLPSTDDVVSGHYKTINREPLTSDHKMALASIASEIKDQDAVLDQMSDVLQRTHHVALNIHDELEKQYAVIENIITKTEKTSAMLDYTNDSMERIHKIVNANSGKFCSYIICLVILFGLAALLYKFLKD